MAVRTRSRRVQDAFELFQLEKRGDRASRATLDFYALQVGAFLRWLERECPQALHFDGLDGTVLRRYRADLADSLTRHGRRLQPESLRASHRGVMAFLRWAAEEGYPVDEGLLRLRPPHRERKEATVYHVAQVRQILSCWESPSEELAVKIMVGSGVRMSELCGLALKGPDGLPDLMLDSLDRGRAELRVRSDGGAKGAKTKRVPITSKLAATIKRYASQHRPESELPTLLLSRRGRPFVKGGIDSMMDRFKARLGFRVHAHAFRHTFATVATQSGWNLERLRVAMGHSDYTVLQRYVELSMQRDLGPLKEWRDLLVLGSEGDGR
ncbi:MAG TPA: tyrosine-type recombinase/integrase [Candidatus Dormibacteraeota bacterium]